MAKDGNSGMCLKPGNRWLLNRYCTCWDTSHQGHVLTRGFRIWLVYKAGWIAPLHVFAEVSAAANREP